MSMTESIFMAFLFVVFIPGILFSLPPGGSKLIVAVTHAIAFVVIYKLTIDTVLEMTGEEIQIQEVEGFGRICYKKSRGNYVKTKCGN